jgi:NAD-reducing hydrogenase small subunit
MTGGRSDRTSKVAKPTLATCALAGCFGCHMSLLDIDERILELTEMFDLDRSPLNDKKAFDSIVDVGFVEGGCASERDVAVLRDFREHCRILLAVGACAITGGVPALRNPIGVEACLAATYGAAPPDDPELPRLLDRVYPAPEVVRIDYYLPGCPPSADAIWESLKALAAGRAPHLPYALFKYD